MMSNVKDLKSENNDPTYRTVNQKTCMYVFIMPYNLSQGQDRQTDNLANNATPKFAQQQLSYCTTKK
jgi:hypothetical protein